MARQGIINQTAGATMADDVVTALNNTNKLLEDFLKKFEEQQKTLEKRYKDVINVNQKTQTIVGEIKKQSKDLGIVLGNELGRARVDFEKQHKATGETQKTLVEIRGGLSEQEKSIQGYFAKRDRYQQEATQKAKIREDFERTKYVARQLWESQITSSIKDIIDNQIKQMNEMGKQRGLDREETVKLYQDINGIRQELNIKGGYLFSNEQVRQAMESLAKANLSFSEQKAYAGVMTQATAFFPGAQGFENVIRETSQIMRGAGKTVEDTQKILNAQLGLYANVHQRLDKEYTQGELLSSINANRLKQTTNIATRLGLDESQGLKLESFLGLNETVFKKRLGQGVGEGIAKIQSKLVKAMSARTAEERAKYYSELAPMLAVTNSSLRGMDIESITSLAAKDPTVILKDFINPIVEAIASGNDQISQFLLPYGIDEEQRADIEQKYRGGGKLLIDKEMLSIQEALGETEEQNIKHLKELNDTMAQHQTWLEKLKVGFNNLVNDSAIGQFITSLGIGRFSIADIVLGGSAVKKGVTTIGNIFGKKGLNIRETSFGKGLGSYAKGLGSKTGSLLKGAGSKALGVGSKLLKGFPLLGALLGGGMLASDISSYANAQTEQEKQQQARGTIGTSLELAGSIAGGIIGSVFPGLGTIIGSAVGGLIGNLVSKLDFIMEPLTEAIQPILDDLKPYVDWIKETMSPVLKKAKELASSFGEKVVEIGKIVGEKAIELGKFLKDKIKGFGNFLLEAFQNNTRRLIFGIREVGTAISGVVKGIGASLLGGFGGVTEWIGEKIGSKGVEEFGSSRVKDAELVFQSAGESFSSVKENYNNFSIREGRYINAPGKRLGEAYVPEDNALRRLHKGEMVLTHSLADVFRHGVYNDIFRMAEEESNGRKANPENVVLKWLKGVDKNLVSKSLVNYIEQGMNTLEAKDLFEKNDIGTVMIISGLRSLEKQKNLQKGRGAKNSAHLVGGAVDYNFISNDGTWYKAWNGTHTPNPKYEAVYRAFGDIISYVSGGEVKNGANFNTVDINHIQLADASKKAAMLRRRYEYEMNRQENELYYNKQALGDFLGELESKERGQTMFASDQELERLWRSKEEHERKNKEKEIYNRQSIDDYFGREEVASYGMTMAAPYTR